VPGSGVLTATAFNTLGQIVRTILGSGNFDWAATRLTAAALALFALSVLAQSLQLLFLRAHYAMGETKIPLRNMLFGSLVTIISVLVFRSMYVEFETFRYFIETILRVDSIPGTEILMLPLAYSLGVIASMCAFIVSLRKRFPELLASVRISFLHTFTASVIMGTVAYHSLQFFAQIFDTDTLIGIFMQGACAGILGVLSGVFLLKLMGNQELNEILTSFHRRLSTSKPIATEQENL
jgi:peptidoglycan biosynthesis protein MviN/MurJ (putative lipid II flippase)